MINYEVSVNKVSVRSLDRSKKNILIIGKAIDFNKQKIIVNPVNTKNAKGLYGENSDLYKAYEISTSITNDTNVYCVNCPLFTDFIELIDEIMHYDFDFIVPLDIYLRDVFINPVTLKTTSFCAYYLERLGLTENKTTLIMTDRNSDLYDNIDSYLLDMKSVVNKLIDDNMTIMNKYGNNLVFVLNNLKDNKFSNVYLAATLAACNFDAYPSDIDVPTYYDIDYYDLKDNNNICFYKYHPVTKKTSMEQLNNFKLENTIYKKVLIDLLIKYVVNKLNLTEFTGCLFNPYVKVKIETKVKNILKDLKNDVCADCILNDITFKKTGVGVGTIIVNVSITPHNLLYNINILLEV